MLFRLQKGMMSILVASVLAIGATLWLTASHQSLFGFFQSKQLEVRWAQLHQAKQQLLQFALLQPEIYLTNSDSKFLPAGEIPAIGYFPCPDLDGDGRLLNNETMCGRMYDATAMHPQQTGFAPDPELSLGGENCDGTSACMGYLPSVFASRFFYFAPKKRFYYVLDERFAFQNPHYNSGTSQYFAPLAPTKIQQQTEDQGVPLGLSVNNHSGYVVVLIDAGADGLNAENLNGDRYFQSSAATSTAVSQSANADFIVGITFDEWQQLIAPRLCVESQRWLGLSTDLNVMPAAVTHWANLYDALDNPYGSGLKHWVESCQ